MKRRMKFDLVILSDGESDPEITIDYTSRADHYIEIKGKLYSRQRVCELLNKAIKKSFSKQLEKA
jgi:hypothetical protein